MNMETKTEVDTEVKTNEDISKEAESALYGDDKSSDSDLDESTEEKTTEEESTEEEDSSDSEKTEEETKEEESGNTEDDESKEEVEYDLALSEESLLEEKAVEGIKTFAKENGLSNEVAQNILTKQEEAVSKWSEAQNEAYEIQLGQWRDEVINDKVIGGDNLTATSENAKRATERFGSEEFANILRETGYGDHPEVVKFLSAIGGAMGEDSFIRGGTTNTEKPIEDLFYDNKED